MSPSIREVLALATARLADAEVDSPHHDAQALLAWILDRSPATLLTVGALDDDQASAYDRAVGRRARREPLQHITGVAYFRSLSLRVGPGVFVPRPETEVMTGVAIAELRRLIESGMARPRAVDLCTGSGAVALALASEAQPSRVTAVELSAQAHAFAVRNAQGSGVDVRLGDMATAVDDLEGLVDVVTANPPYIPLTAYEWVAPEARTFDPPLALWSGSDGLDALAVVASVAARLLVDGGLVVSEHADTQGEPVVALFARMGHWVQVRDNLDLAGRPRFVSARRAPRSRGGPGTIAL